MTNIPESNPIEVELKLHLPPGGRPALERLPVFREASAERRHEVSTYFDTPANDLLRTGVALRVRRSGNRLIQTLKSQNSGSGVAAWRGEWEWEVNGEHPDLARLDDTPYRDLVAAVDGQLRPVFTTDIHRTTRLLRLGDAVAAEAALDEGRIVAGEGSENVSELELELKKGQDVGALYRFALEIHASTPLRIAGESKAARGYRLRTGKPTGARKATKIELPETARACEAFRLIVGSTLAHLIVNTVPARLGDAEGTHQMRVALRRMRAALTLFERHLERHAVALFEEELKQLGRLFGAARDWDVFTLETLPKAGAEHPRADWLGMLRQVAEARREDSHRGMVKTLQSPDFTRLVLSLSAWIEDGVREPALLGGGGMQKDVRDLAPDLLDRFARKARKRGRAIGGHDEEALHALRKSLKKLRYGAEFLGSLYKHKAVKAYVKSCEDLQEILGSVNDAQVTIDTAQSLVREGHPDLAPALAALAPWCEARRKKSLHSLKRAWSDFRAVPPFWK